MVVQVLTSFMHKLVMSLKRCLPAPHFSRSLRWYVLLIPWFSATKVHFLFNFLFAVLDSWGEVETLLYTWSQGCITYQYILDHVNQLFFILNIVLWGVCAFVSADTACSGFLATLSSANKTLVTHVRMFFSRVIKVFANHVVRPFPGGVDCEGKCWII